MDNKIKVSDITIKLASQGIMGSLSFRQKIELAKLLERLGVSVIEVGALKNGKQDALLVKSLASLLKKATIAVTVDIAKPESIDEAWSALQSAKHPRLQVSVPVSTVQMEYLCHKKPVALVQAVADCVKKCAEVCKDVEFLAEDFGRSDEEFLMQVVNTAVENGASTISVYDSASEMFDYEFFKRTRLVRNALPKNVTLGAICPNDLYMADPLALAAIRAGAREIKTTPYGNKNTSLKRFVKIVTQRQDVFDVGCDVKTIELERVVEQIQNLCEADRNKPLASLDGVQQDTNELKLSINDDYKSVMKVAKTLGYELNGEEGKNVYSAFMTLASKNETVSAKELDAIIASVAFQVPATYKLESYLINSGNVITSTCHLILRKNDEVLEGVCIGDGPIDSAFLAIEKLIGNKYELDDFQIRSVTEGTKAMGESIVRLRSAGKVYSGRGISRDIVAASILAYLSAVNKIVFEEDEA